MVLEGLKLERERERVVLDRGLCEGGYEREGWVGRGNVREGERKLWVCVHILSIRN